MTENYIRKAATFITYQPDSTVVENIKKLSLHVDKIYIFDNSETIDSVIKSALEQIPKASLIIDGGNKGIAVRLNQACAISSADGFDWLLTMDQDSFFEDSQLNKYFECLHQLQTKESISMVGVEIENKAGSEMLCQAMEVTHIITSGSFVNLKVFEKMGGFDESLFIDYVDTDYCYASLLNKYRIIKFKNIYMNHSIGSSSVHRSLKTLKATSRSLHVPSRLYYMTRNNLYLNKKYKNHFNQDTKRRNKDLFHRIKNNILYNKQRISAIRYIIRGWKDFKISRMGKLQF